MAFYLVDDGTMDTVVRCTECGQEERYNFQCSDGEETYDDFVEWALEDVAEGHELDGCYDESREPY